MSLDDCNPYSIANEILRLGWSRRSGRQLDLSRASILRIGLSAVHPSDGTEHDPCNAHHRADRSWRCVPPERCECMYAHCWIVSTFRCVQSTHCHIIPPCIMSTHLYELIRSSSMMNVSSHTAKILPSVVHACRQRCVK